MSRFGRPELRRAAIESDWHADPYFLSPGPKSLLTLFGAEHGLSGISGYDVAETTDENPVARPDGHGFPSLVPARAGRPL